MFPHCNCFTTKLLTAEVESDSPGANPSVHPLNLPEFLIVCAISKCLEESEGIGSSGAVGLDLFISAVTNEYLRDANQVRRYYFKLLQ
jgi:hypothetical protein